MTGFHCVLTWCQSQRPPSPNSLSVSPAGLVPPIHLILFQPTDLRDALKLMGGYAMPGPVNPNHSETLIWILLTVEVEGNFTIADRMSSLSGATAVNNILQLKKRIGREAGFYNEGRVFSLLVGSNSLLLRLMVHWVFNVDGEDCYHTTGVKS